MSGAYYSQDGAHVRGWIDRGRPLRRRNHAGYLHQSVAEFKVSTFNLDLDGCPRLRRDQRCDSTRNEEPDPAARTTHNSLGVSLSTSELRNMVADYNAGVETATRRVVSPDGTVTVVRPRTPFNQVSYQPDLRRRTAF